MPLIRVAPSAISGNNAWGMVPSSWRVPGDLDNHGRYHFYFPLSILVHPDDDHPNPISASRYPQRPSTQTLRRSGGLSLRLGDETGLPGHRQGLHADLPAGWAGVPPVLARLPGGAAVQGILSRAFPEVGTAVSRT